MKALTVRNPHAWAIIYGGKSVENRDWDTPYRGLLLIHAGLSKEEVILDPDEAPDVLPDGTLAPHADEMVFGAIIGTVELVDVVEEGNVKVKDSPWADGPYCFILANPRPLAQPVVCKGQLKLWSLPESVEAAIKAQLED